MNRFRSRKKAKEAVDKNDAPPVPALPVFPFKKGKKVEPETKPEVDLSTALPSSDDFRTSLLMPNLSARFSMLREQDDPSSKIGKANDDSVLFPKRASRLNLFNNSSQLNDIAEVTSLTGSSRPSLAIGRSSFTSGEGGYATDDDSASASIMNRSRPVDGNNLFGGRQKIYKIPVSESQESNANRDSAGASRSKGRPLYENDVTLSAFQKLKREELRQKLESESAMNREQQEPAVPAVPEITSSRPSSPPPGNRISNSTDSINSQNRASERGQGTTNLSQPSSGRQTPIGGVERSQTKSRRLYEQGLERHQPSSALNRLESLSRQQRAAPNDNILLNRSLSKSAVSLNEQYQKPSPVYASSTFRPTSPPVSASSSINAYAPDGGRKLASVTSPRHSETHGMASPLSPPLSESSETSAFMAAVHPDDRGKATATGLFNKPASKYDDNQFSQLQLQIHEGRGTPPPRRSPSQTQPEIPNRSRAFSNTSHQSKTESPVLPSNTMQHTGRRPDHPISPIGMGKAQPAHPPAGMFTGMFNSSDNESDGEGDAFKSKTSSMSQAYDGVQSSFRTSMESRDSTHSASSALKSLQPPPLETRYSESRDLNTIDENVPAETENAAVKVDEPAEAESDPDPTPAPTFGGLSGLIRTHLRQDSDRSSILPPPSPVLPPASENYRQVNPLVQEARDSNHAESIHSNPWEFDEWTKQSQTSRTESRPASQSGQPAGPPPPPQQPQPPSPPPPQPLQPTQPDISSMSLRAKQILGQAQAAALSSRKQEEEGRHAKAATGEVPHEPQPLSPLREENAKHGHHRGGSSETQMDREEFANELAERRRKVQEKLRSLAESESRSSSPGPGQQRFSDNPGKAGNAFAMLKSKANRNQAYTKQDILPKHPNRPGMDRTGPSASSPSLQSADAWREEEENMIRDMPRKPRSESPSVNTRHPNMPRSQYMPAHPRRSDDDVRNALADGSSSPSLRNQSRDRSSRDRSGSDTSGRSKSRPRYREDLESVRENTEQPQNPPVPDTRSRAPSSVPSSTRPSIEVADLQPRDRAGSVTGGRFRSNSRAAPPHLDFDNKQAPIQPGPFPGMNNSPRPSPVTPYSANTTPPLYETSPATSVATTPTFAGATLSNQGGYQQRNQGSLGQHRRIVDKHQISEPKLLSSTSNVPTVGLPPGASLSNGTPPIPPMNPRRRRQTTTQTILGAFKGSERYDTNSSSAGTPRHSGEGEHSTFSDDEEKRPRPRQRLRKISSEGGSLNARARQQIMSASTSTPALPHYPKNMPPAVEGGMI